MTRTVREALSVIVFVFGLVTASVAQQTATEPQPRPAAPEQLSPSDADQDVETVGTAEADEALQQLIAQAEALAGAESPATVGAIALIGEELEALKAALALKASLLDEDEDTVEADLEIASRSESLQAAIAAVTEPDASLEPAPTPENASDDRSNLIRQIDSYVGDALSLLSKIQELLVVHRDEAAETEPGIPGDAGASEEVLQDVTGVVTESGEPLEGVSVTDPESSVTAVTDAEGHYTLQGLPAGRSARLILSKAGTQVGEGQLDLTAGRDGVGDFDLKPSGERSRPVLRVLPYVVAVRGAKTGNENRGSLTGTLRDADGQVVPRALVSLGKLARARTNSNGQYAFLHVPAGTYELKVFKPGFPIESERVGVTATRIDATISLRPRSSRRGGDARALIRAGSGTHMRGLVSSAAGPPIRAAKVTLMQAGKAVSVRSGPRGDFLFRDLEAGRYRVLVSKAGYQSLAETVSVEPGASRVRSYQLKRTALRPSVTSGAKTGVAAPAAVRANAIAAGRVVGRVFHATTRAPVPGALVILPGHEPVKTNAAGSYTIKRVPAARHRVVVKTKGFAAADRHVQVARGRVARLDFALAPDRPDAAGRSGVGRRAAGVLLAGRVLDVKTRRPIAGAVVFVGATRVATDPAGRFRVPHLRQGAHRIVIRAEGYQQASETMTLGPEDRTTSTFTLIRVAAPARR